MISSKDDTDSISSKDDTSSKRRTLEPCEQCGKRVEELVTREYFVMSYAVEWVCEKCFEKLEGVSFDDFMELDNE